MIFSDATLILQGSDDLDNWDAHCGCNLGFLLVPRRFRKTFFSTTAWLALQPCLRTGIVVFYGDDDLVEFLGPKAGWGSPSHVPDADWPCESLAGPEKTPPKAA